MSEATETDGIVRALVEERKRRDMSQRDIVRLLGCSSATVCNWERGRNSPTLNHLRAWTGALGFNLALTTTSTDAVRGDEAGT